MIVGGASLIVNCARCSIVNGAQLIVNGAQLIVNGAQLIVNGAQLIVNGAQLIAKGAQPIVSGAQRRLAKPFEGRIGNPRDLPLGVARRFGIVLHYPKNAWVSARLSGGVSVRGPAGSLSVADSLSRPSVIRESLRRRAALDGRAGIRSRHAHGHRGGRSAGGEHPAGPTCRFCGAALEHTFVDLGMSPLCESYVPADRVAAMEAFYPLHAKVCESCLLVQLEEFVSC